MNESKRMIRIEHLSVKEGLANDSTSETEVEKMVWVDH